MITFRPPNDEQLRSILDQQKNAPFSYPDVASSRQSNLPTGYNIDRYRTKLGSGAAAYETAKEALRRWAMFDIGWLRIFPRDLEIRKDTVVAVVISHYGFWSVNVSRIVYIVESEGPRNVLGFAYGTLPEHMECGEERFTVSWSPSDDFVWYEIVALSKPRHVLARIGYPFSRRLQKRFGHDSLAAMRGRFKE